MLEDEGSCLHSDSVMLSLGASQAASALSCLQLHVCSAASSSPNQHDFHRIYFKPATLDACHAQVVMSRGGYTDSIDMWSLGCIFGELLQRVAKIGSASTPRLQVAPLFAITGRPRTPCEG